MDQRYETFIWEYYMVDESPPSCLDRVSQQKKESPGRADTLGWWRAVYRSCAVSATAATTISQIVNADHHRVSFCLNPNKLLVA